MEGGDLSSRRLRNLVTGDFRLIIAVDEITERLKRTVVFINSQMPPRFGSWRWSCAALGRTGSSAEAGVLRRQQRGDRPPPPYSAATEGRLIEGSARADAARAAESLLDWAERKDLTVSYTAEETGRARNGRDLTPDGDRLFRIKQQREVRVSFTALRRQTGTKNASAGSYRTSPRSTRGSKSTRSPKGRGRKRHLSP